LDAFVKDKGLVVLGVYSEHVSGTTLDRPELMRLLDAAQPGECIVCESVDRLSRLSQLDWETLKAKIKAKGLRLVIADLPTTHMLIDDKGMTGQIMAVINSMLLDLMATMARLDQEKRVERIRQGLENKRLADPKWTPVGKGKNIEKWAKVKLLMAKHPTMSANDIAKLAEVGVATVYRIKKTSTG
jgi:DNA invertase Pin-like site-specific DNA recombinase